MTQLLWTMMGTHRAAFLGCHVRERNNKTQIWGNCGESQEVRAFSIRISHMHSPWRLAWTAERATRGSELEI